MGHPHFAQEHGTYLYRTRLLVHDSSDTRVGSRKKLQIDTFLCTAAGLTVSRVCD